MPQEIEDDIENTHVESDNQWDSMSDQELKSTLKEKGVLTKVRNQDKLIEILKRNV